MNDIKQTLLNESNRLKNIIGQTMERLKDAPEGCLIIDGSSGTPRFSQLISVSVSNSVDIHNGNAKNYNGNGDHLMSNSENYDSNTESYNNSQAINSCGNNNKRQKIYLGNSEMDKIKLLAQKAYDKKILHAARKQDETITRFLKSYNPDSLKDIYAAQSEIRRTMIKTAEYDDETFARLWAQVTYAPSTFEVNDPEFITLKGERVRSKSEKMAADEMLYEDIPYRYEPPLHIIPDRSIWRPDFMVLNKRTRKEYIWEHFGKMDDPEYCNKNVRKLNLYIENGFYPGINLIVTMESSKNPLSTKHIKQIIEKYFK